MSSQGGGIKQILKNMEKKIYMLLLAVAFLLSGCQISLSLNKKVECQPPLKVISGQCCLDQDNNNVCDQVKEPATKNDQAQKNQGKEAGSAESSSESAVAKNTANVPAENATSSAESGQQANLDFQSQCQPPLIATDNGCCLDADEDGNCDEEDDASPCGDGVCQQSEINTCCLDCGCPTDKTCLDNECVVKLTISPGLFKDIIKPKLPPSFCGDGVCNSGESSDNCCSDCGCPNGLVCGVNNKCFIFKIPSVPLNPLPHLNQTDQPQTKDWIVVTLDKIEVHTSGDKKDPGELMFFSFAQSGAEKQYVKWPVGGEKAMWSGQTLLAGELEAVPLFALPEEKMGDKLDIDLLFGESDLPSVVPYLNSTLDREKVKYFFQYNSCRSKADLPAWARLMTETVFKPFMLLTDLINHHHCHANDFLGEIHRVFSRPDWQLGKHKVDLNNITVYYQVRKVTVNPQQAMSLKLTGVRIVDDGDKGDNPGEIVGWGRLVVGFTENSFGTGVNNNQQKVFDLGQHKLNGPADLGTDLSAASYSVVGQPFIYGELSLFDRDSDCNDLNNTTPFSCYHTSKLEEVGITSLLFFPDTQTGTYVINSGGVGRADTTWEFSK